MKKMFKKIAPVLLAGTMLAGCGLHLDRLSDVEVPTFPADETPVITTAEPAAAAEPVTAEETAQPAAAQDAAVTVSIKNLTEEYYDPADGKFLILTFGYDSPRVTIDGNDEAASAINEYVAMMEDTWYTGNDHGAGTATGRDMMLEIATDYFTYVYATQETVTRLDMEADRSVNVKRADSSAVAYLFNDYTYTGVRQETNTSLAVNFDTQTGKLLTFADIAADQSAEAAVIRAMAGNNPAGDSLVSALSTAIANGQWYFGKEGITVFLQPADAAVFYGQEEYTMPYAELQSFIQPQYLPSYGQSTGTVSIIPLSEYQENTAEILDRVAADENGTEFLLQVQGTVSDVRLARVDYSNDGFYETGELWYRSVMTDASLQLCTVIPEGMPNLMLSYTESGTQHVCYISESGENGQPFLSENIQAIG